MPAVPLVLLKSEHHAGPAVSPVRLQRRLKHGTFRASTKQTPAVPEQLGLGLAAHSTPDIWYVNLLTKKLGRLLAGAGQTSAWRYVVPEHVRLGPAAHSTPDIWYGTYLPRSWVDFWLEQEGPQHEDRP